MAAPGGLTDRGLEPVLAFCLARLAAAAARPVAIGIQGPQGCGKTTIAAQLIARFSERGLRGVSVSIDDFYLTRREQLGVAAEHPGNPYLEHRGYPGTHDIALGERTIAALRALGPGTSEREVRVPVYDKSAQGGRGDRAPESEWRRVTAPLDLVIVEGWMLGFEPVARGRVSPARARPVPLSEHLLAIDRALADYDRWHRQLDAMVVLRPLDPDYVIAWRVEAEENMKRSGRPGLGRDEIEDYVRRFLPAYRLYGGAPARMPRERVLTLWVDESRRFVPAPPGAAS